MVCICILAGKGEYIFKNLKFLTFVPKLDFSFDFESPEVIFENTAPAATKKFANNTYDGFYFFS